MECNNIKNPEQLTRIFKEADNFELNKVFKCFFSLFYDKFKQFVYKHYTLSEEAVIKDAFTDGLVDFYKKVKATGFEDRGAAIETFFIEFCKRKLLGRFTDTKRQLKQYSSTDPVNMQGYNTALVSSNYTDISEKEQVMQEKEEALLLAWRKQGKRCCDLLRWRKIEKLGNDEIAMRMNINPGTVNNEVYKCFNQLKKYAAEIAGKQIKR